MSKLLKYFLFFFGIILIFSGIYFLYKIPRELIDEIIKQSPVNMVCSFLFICGGFIFVGMFLSPDEKIRTFDEVKSSFIVKNICGERGEFARLNINGYGECFVKMTTEMGTPITLENFKEGQHYFKHNCEWIAGYDTTKDAE